MRYHESIILLPAPFSQGFFSILNLGPHFWCWCEFIIEFKAQTIEGKKNQQNKI